MTFRKERTLSNKKIVDDLVENDVVHHHRPVQTTRWCDRRSRSAAGNLHIRPTKQTKVWACARARDGGKRPCIIMQNTAIA
jgi:hypothetical protein